MCWRYGDLMPIRFPVKQYCLSASRMMEQSGPAGQFTVGTIAAVTETVALQIVGRKALVHPIHSGFHYKKEPATSNCS